ncbi:parathyroid hormone/parathyroid hormone-related peptide receptor-like isoform X1 [Scylla paramamosain]|uniref:parathyroid hormone/parathyroid hormone-related peptide receptor-like isoform X1 n=1 Tax=Scylla paramamosain TaxID=85552 RepID=UPI003082A715
MARCLIPEDSYDLIDGSANNISESGGGVHYNDSWTETEKRRWLQLLFLRQEAECRKLQLQEAADTSTTGEPGPWCPRVWDKMLCWGPTAPNTTTSQPCPHYVPGIRPQAPAWRRCGADGVWEGGQELGWTNYTLCLGTAPNATSVLPVTVLGEWLPTIKRMSLIGYSVSLATLVISFTILASLRRLRCPRNLLHLHLFGSFMLRALVVLLKSTLLLDGVALPINFSIQDGEAHFNDNSQTAVDASPQTWACKLMICVWQYFILANYSWLLMEGLYLHSLIFMALFTDSSAITLYILLGWGLPLGCVAMWATLRATLDDTHCWTVNNVQWIFWVSIRAPVAISNLINFSFFLNVVRVLILKLRSSISAESMKYRKLGKSTLVLVPLFGVHYFVLWGLSTSTNTYVELVWLFLDQVFASFQGFFVAVLYCLMNGEVRQELRKLYNRWYKGDPLVVNSQSTMISHTKTYASRGRTSLHSIHSQAERKDRQTPSPQMARSTGSDAPNFPCPNNTSASPSPTATLTPTYNSKHHSRDVTPSRVSSDLCDETIEMQTCSSLEGPQGKSLLDDNHHSLLPPSSPKPTNMDQQVPKNGKESTQVEILINLQDNNHSNFILPPNNSNPLLSHNGQVMVKTKEKHLTFSESTEQFQIAKVSPMKENGSVMSEGGTKMENMNKGMVCVSVNKNSLKSSTPQQIDSHLVPKNTKVDERETML